MHIIILIFNGINILTVSSPEWKCSNELFWTSRNTNVRWVPDAILNIRKFKMHNNYYTRITFYVNRDPLQFPVERAFEIFSIHQKKKCVERHNYRVDVNVESLTVFWAYVYLSAMHVTNRSVDGNNVNSGHPHRCHRMAIYTSVTDFDKHKSY